MRLISLLRTSEDDAERNGKEDLIIELLFVSCLSADPASCQDRSLIFIDMSLMTCMVHGQQEMARWQANHPKETVREWKCRMAEKRTADI